MHFSCFRLSIVQQTRVSLALSEKKKAAASWHNSLQKFRNGMLYCLAFIPESTYDDFRMFWGHIHKIQTPSPYHGDVMVPFIFPYGLRLNMEAYLKCLEESAAWTKRVATRKFLQPYYLQHLVA